MKMFSVILVIISSFPAIGNAQASTNQTDSGLKIYRRAPEQQISFLLNLAQAYFEDKDYEAAANSFNRILEIDPDHEIARYSLGSVYISANKPKKAEQILLGMIQEHPNDYKLKNNLAWLYATAKDFSIRDGKKAVKIAQEALVIAPNDYHVWSTLSEAYYISGEYEKAYRAIKHMASLASRYAKKVTKEDVESYNDQIRKCKRAWDTAEAMKTETE